jgi:hypothetical protein
MKAFGYLLIVVGGLIMIVTPFSDSIFMWPQNIPSWLGYVVGLIVLLMGGVLASSGEKQSFVPDKQLLKTEDAYPCPICNQKDFTWGMIRSPYPARFTRRMIGIIGYGTPVLTRLCNHCGNLVLFAREKRP